MFNGLTNESRASVAIFPIAWRVEWSVGWIIIDTITFGEVLRSSSVLELLTLIRPSFFWGLADFGSGEDRTPVSYGSVEIIPWP